MSRRKQAKPRFLKRKFIYLKIYKFIRKYKYICIAKYDIVKLVNIKKEELYLFVTFLFFLINGFSSFIRKY